jgi:hypothetical protein
MKILDRYGIERDSNDLQAVQKLETLKKENGSDPWPVIEECFHIFEQRHLQEYKSYIIHLDNIRKTRKDPKYASTKDPISGGYLRYTLDIPEPVMRMIRGVYNPDELPMNKEFYTEFARRFRNYRIAEKM